MSWAVPLSQRLRDPFTAGNAKPSGLWECQFDSWKADRFKSNREGVAEIAPWQRFATSLDATVRASDVNHCGRTDEPRGKARIEGSSRKLNTTNRL